MHTIYKKNFLAQVICRIDFSSEVSSLTSDDAARILLKYFQKVGLVQQIIVNGPLGSKDNTPVMQKVFSDRAGKNKATLSERCIILEFTNYQGFDALFYPLDALLKNVYSNNQSPLISRIGLRYINHILPPQKIYKNFFQSGVENAIVVPIASSIYGLVPIRSMHTCEYSYDKYRLAFNFGLFNRSYPDRVNYDDFVLDYDCFVDEPVCTYAEAISTVQKEHELNINLFEDSITDRFRAVMNDGK